MTMLRACMVLLVLAAGVPHTLAQTLTTLYDFCSESGCPGGYFPTGQLVQGLDGAFYGVTYFGSGVFKIGTGGHLTTIYTFCSQPNCSDGKDPLSGLALGNDGNFYGTTTGGGSAECDGQGCGTVFKLTPEGALTTLYRFCSLPNCADGIGVEGALVQTANGDLYGTASSGGLKSPNCDPEGCGTIFRVTPEGLFRTVYQFCSRANCTDGAWPINGVIQASDGNFYGVTYEGGAGGTNCPNGCGTIFKITPNGNLTTLYTFCSQLNCTDGAFPWGGLFQGSDGDLYGTTTGGGNSPNCTLGCGTIFKIPISGGLTTLYSFCLKTGCPDGLAVQTGLLEATDDNFYGVSSFGGNDSDGGTVFRFEATGMLTVLYDFCSVELCWDGTRTTEALTQATTGTLYDTTEEGGRSEYCGLGGDAGCGTVFSLSVGLRPFVKTRPTSGAAGSNVLILGNNLEGATSVTFNGTSAAFTVESDTLISASVPAGADSGFVRVVTPKQALKSNAEFDVIP
jgi:uncharacterized repeat protein (TIGR03803 family)